MPDTDYSSFKKALAESKNIVVLAGAGFSAASGIPTFRGAGGFWRQYQATDLATPEAFQRDPVLVWQFYQYRRQIVMKAEPNPAHRIVAQLCSSSSKLAKIAPLATSFRLMTQNIDNLSTRALPDGVSPSALPIEIHGNLFQAKCTVCGLTEENHQFELADSWDKNQEQEQDADTQVKPTVKDLPHCRQCGGLLRPDVVWFGEEPHRLDETADIITKECDFLIVVGTTGAVTPCGIFPDLVRDAGGQVAVFNLETTYNDRQANFIFRGPCEETLVEALS
ncbi:hypothetical protein D9758_002926 [Tetrapyrgos nigripes]|uniref:Deacetylase sirtuin-type domain-containing protein n=1 Tax=Tetrapyrgos nigripes TaxID=182062 RepID=A0A8H5LT52_9AGAR|nr:hypothetical protein D9758_002926 [Tetrapyrgos nigripes]